MLIFVHLDNDVTPGFDEKEIKVCAPSFRIKTTASKRKVFLVFEFESSFSQGLVNAQLFCFCSCICDSAVISTHVFKKALCASKFVAELSTTFDIAYAIITFCACRLPIPMLAYLRAATLFAPCFLLTVLAKSRTATFFALKFALAMVAYLRAATLFATVFLLAVLTESGTSTLFAYIFQLAMVAYLRAAAFFAVLLLLAVLAKG